MLHCQNIPDVYTPGKMALWLLSAFKAGFINSAGFLLTGKFVSHVTGFGTQVGIAMGHSDYFFGTELLIIPLSFIGGGVISSLILDNTNDNKIPSYHYVQGLITLLILVIIVLGEKGFISAALHFDDDQKYDFMEFSIIAILCLICGLKNSLVTWTTYGKIRVTHLSGISTDIGLNLTKTLGLKSKNPRFNENPIINLHRIATLFSFSVGAFISAVMFPRFGHKSFYIVLTISLLMTVLAFCARRETQERLIESYS